MPISFEAFLFLLPLWYVSTSLMVGEQQQQQHHTKSPGWIQEKEEKKELNIQVLVL